MNENIDLTKILKDCPIGWEFYSTIYGNVTFCRIENDTDTDCPIVFFFIDKDGIEMYRSVTKQGLYDTNCYGECTFFPSKDQRDWSKFTAPWYKKERFDPNTLKPFDKVLARHYYTCKWKTDFYSHTEVNSGFSYICTNNTLYKYCIPYNDETKHLVGTTEEAPEYYRYWED